MKIKLRFPHVHDATNAVTGLHILESIVDLGKRLTVSDEFVNLEFSLHVVVDQVGKLRATLDTTECTPLCSVSTYHFVVKERNQPSRHDQ